MQRKQSYSQQKVIVFVSAIFIIAALIILLSSCNILQNIFGEGSNDTTPPTIISVSPKDGETNVPINTSIIVEFSETMNEADTQEAFTILPSVTGSFIWSNQSTVMTFAPDSYLEANETYTINIATEAKDVAGNTLESPYQWIFQTGSGANIDTTAPEEVSGFTATAGDGEVQLSWSNPSDADFAGVVLVYRTDRYPQAPDDGTEIYTGSGTSFNHTGLTNGTTYYYTIFAYDGVPNYSGGVQASATPQYTPPANTGVDWAQATNSVEFGDRETFGTIVYDNKIWVIGGYENGNYHNDVWYSSDGITWTEATASASFPARMDALCVVFNNKIWVSTGWTGSTRLDDVWSSSDGINWTQITSSAGFGIRNAPGFVVFNNKMWIIAGYGPGSGQLYNDVWYSSDGVNWTQATSAAPFSKRQRFGCVVFDNKIWVIGGYQSTTQYLNDIWYSSDGVNWTQATASAPFSNRCGFGCVVYDNKIWVIGGIHGGSTPLNDVWYSSDGVNWTEATSVADFSARRYHGSVAFNDKIWVIGGYGNGNYYDDIWYTPPD